MLNQISRADYVELVAGVRPDHAITLCAGLACTAAVLDIAAERFLNRVQRAGHGRNWHKRRAAERLEAVGFFEHHDTNLHLHIAARLPTERLREAATDGERLWRLLRPAGAYECEPIAHIARHNWYITKELWDPRTRNQIFVYSGADNFVAYQALRTVKWM